MGPDIEDSSSAAPSAQGDSSTSESPTRRPGLFARLTGMISTYNEPADPSADAGDTPTSEQPKVGLGNLRLKRVEDVMIPRADIVAVPHSIKLDELVGTFRDSGLTRIPVFEDTLDTPIGMIHLKDMALKHGFPAEGKKGGRFLIKRMVRDLLYVPASMPIGVLLQKMQRERKHMALVIDEYGGVDGLVTIEDLIEQVIGEIEDEHDVGEADLWTKEKTGIYLIRSRAPLEDFEEDTGLRLSDAEMDEEIDTIGGLVAMLAGRVPARGEVVPHPSGAEFEIVDADPRRIKRVRLRMQAQVLAGE